MTLPRRNQRLAGTAFLAGAFFCALPAASAEPPRGRWTQADFGGVLSVGLEGHRDYQTGLRRYNGLCAECHTLGKHGRGAAPDLTRRALTYTPEELLEHLLANPKHLPPRPRQGTLLDPLSQADVLDLLAFVLSGADPKSPFFLHP
jgi:mono/diheme cytochrome c family protein